MSLRSLLHGDKEHASMLFGSVSHAPEAGSSWGFTETAADTPADPYMASLWFQR